MANETYVTLVGNLTADPKLAVVNETPVANFTVATQPRIYNKMTEQWESGPTSFHDCEAWGKDPVRHIAESLVKGSRVIVYGTLRQLTFTSRDGEERRKWLVRVDDIGASLKFVSAALSETDGVHKPSARSTAAEPPF